MTDEQANELLEFFKALAHPNRLKIIGLLAQRDLTVGELAEILDLRPSTVSNHLSNLSWIGLVSSRAEGHYHIYRFETAALHDMARRLLSRETLQEAAADVDLNAYDRKVIQNYMGADGRFKRIPTKQKKLEAVLRYVLPAFKPGVRYTEKQVNEILSQYNEDYALLRRELVEFKMMGREGGGGEYWVIEE